MNNSLLFTFPIILESGAFMLKDIRRVLEDFHLVAIHRQGVPVDEN